MIPLKAPASKSVSHRMLIAASLARGVSSVHHALSSADLERTREILHAAGAVLEDTGGGSWRVQGMPHGPEGGKSVPLNCYVGESGTTCRLLAAVLAAGRGSFRIHGVERMHERPIGALTNALSALGARVFFERKEGYPPLVMETEGLSGGNVDMGVDESSQFLSGLLLAAPFCREAVCISLTGKKAVSWPYVGLTLQVLEDFGIGFQVEAKEGETWREAPWRSVRQATPGKLRIRVFPGAYRCGEYHVEGDWSGASYLLAAGAVGRESVLVQGLRADSLQGDRTILDILRAMGADISLREDGIQVSPSKLHGITVDMGACPDLVPTVAMAAAYAEGDTRMENIAHLRIKECDRIAACAAELARAHVPCEEEEGALTVHGLAPDLPDIKEGTVFHTYNDHRIAMAAALLGLGRGQRIVVDDPAVVRKSFPEFWNVWSALS
ncbi:3-phosphoshikimate 1-carboxyvinyltransferase [Mailhella massiliensis]|uniref:3-phosphoshikimate 1-carboxyvinyltransferase n=1 Tax=Mailhella massiliensis TaxID=1903261 RepID=A0A921DRU3_9BACT|nr:3-phosphoshikimate 1-carboxyvinyltransferase [Mailhella massiliensis]HJD97431.1 3-phosphoshikimate 1-carboxyvinyltransferase [Mailhella massiliensis]